jgi:PPK2 family polyphosphate:nucleotide phosphotransferase
MNEKHLQMFQVKPGARVQLQDYPTRLRERNGAKGNVVPADKDEAKRRFDERRAELANAQELLYANDVHAVLIVFQAMDAAGKDSTIRHVMSGVNPQGCQVFSFKQPSAEELDHNFLWRYASRVPERGRIGIFNRSYYEEVLVVRVHPEWLDRQRLPPGKRGDGFWKKRFQDINHFERHLTRSGTLILKFFLHVSKEEQKKRFMERLNRPEKYWKFSAADLDERACWKSYMKAYEEALSATSTDWAPWFIVPADHKPTMQALVADIVATSIRGLGLKPPTLSAAHRRDLAAAKRRLQRE